MGRRTVAVAVLLVIGAGMLMCCLRSEYIWDGSFNLTVRVSSDAGPPRSVTCEAFGRREHAEAALEHPLSPESLGSAAVERVGDGPLTVTVPVSGRDSVCGRELSRVQFRYLVVIAVLPDGLTVGKLVDIPDGQLSREVSVTLP